MTATAENTTEPVDLLSPDLIADPFGAYARMREQAPTLTGSIMGGRPMWLVTRYEDVRRVLTDPRFHNNPASVPDAPDTRTTIMRQLNLPTDLVDYLEDKLMQIDGADHRRLRGLVSKAFTARRVARLRPRVEEITTALLDGMADAGRDGTPVDLLTAFCYPLPFTVICELVGIDEADRAPWFEWGHCLSSPTEHRERLPQVMRECVDHMLEAIARRRAEPRDDLISALIQAQEDDGDRLSEREMVTLVFTLVITGHETTTHLLANSVLALLENPDQLALVRADPSRWPQAVNELMRLGPTQWGLPRHPSEDVELGGVTIPAGATVMPLILPANTDPRRYEEPERLDVGRGAGQSHLGFGQGAHYCLGAPLALQEAEVALHALFDRFPGLSLAVRREEIRWTLRPGVTRVDTLPLRLV
ncbi:6-deoxyerythronolide B hydroxylase [Streptomyces sp. YIM 121038]|uniref:cytochrome P450 family protein n=1 Tax=unclassified Streptomyces TaxID=2593676 RepID=UPI00110FF8D6|nr:MULTISPECIES: cytochrome P450 [unclassified Streptomyces]QCX80471.1 6-deoxyerythronolide B hydroxylase [Streptomyces sp. YIM 121038]